MTEEGRQIIISTSIRDIQKAQTRPYFLKAENKFKHEALISFKESNTLPHNFSAQTLPPHSFFPLSFNTTLSSAINSLSTTQILTNISMISNAMSAHIN